MDKKQVVKIGGVIVLVVVVVVGGIIWRKRKQLQTEIGAQKNKAQQEESVPVVDEIVSDNTKTYTHPNYGFSIDYPDNFTIGNFPEEVGNTILVQGADGKNGFQIFVSAYEEKTPLSADSIKLAADGLNVKDIKGAQIGKDKLDAFTFTLETAGDPGDASSSADTTNEVWFVRDGNLYQITSYADFQDKMPKILDSWRFN